jgi:hypothetical protein
MKAVCCIALLVIFSLPAHAQQWDKYTPKNKRKDVFKKTARGTGMGAAMTGQAGAAYWITEDLARVLVSETIDKERLTNEEAEARYKILRPLDSYCFMVLAIRVALIGARASELDNPIAKNEIFLQREDNKNKFSKGSIVEHNFDMSFGGLIKPANLQNSYIVQFPRKDRTGEPLVKSLSDKIEIQFTMSGKKVILDYNLKDTVTRLEDL